MSSHTNRTNARHINRAAHDFKAFSAVAAAMATPPSLYLVVRFGGSGTASERQVGAGLTPGNGFSFVTGLGPVPGPVTPVTRSDRRPFPGDMVDHVPKSPACVFGVIRGEPECCAIDENTRDAIQVRWRDESPLVMAALRPRIRKQEEQAANTGIGQGIEQNLSIVIVNQYVLDPLGIDGAEQP